MTVRAFMVVDDDSAARLLVERAMQRVAPRVVVEACASGSEAIETLQRTSSRDRPAVVLLDVQMPGMDGFEVLGRLRSSAVTRLIPVVMFSTSDRSSDVVRAFEAGSNAYVVKPDSFHDLMDTLRSINSIFGRSATNPVTQVL